MFIGADTVIARNSWLIAVKGRDGYFDTSLKIRFAPFTNLDDEDDENYFTISHTNMIRISKKFMSLLALKLGLRKNRFKPTLKHCCMDGWVVEDTVWFDTNGKTYDRVMSNIKKALDDIDGDITDLVNSVVEFKPRSDDE